MVTSENLKNENVRESQGKLEENWKKTKAAKVYKGEKKKRNRTCKTKGETKKKKSVNVKEMQIGLWRLPVANASSPTFR
jgi:hypothetical protein